MHASQEVMRRLGELKAEIDAVLAVHAKRLQQQTAQDYTPYSVQAVEAYTQVLARGGKRIRGALTVVGYDMCGGSDRAMILQAACAIELVHAYILVLDDIMDKSATRRGGPSAHAALSDYHRRHSLSSDSAHFGEAVAINSALIGNHYAQSLVTGLAVADNRKVKVLHLLNEALVVTGHGQINDIFNEVVDTVDDHAVDKVLEWKTAYYTFLNPLQFGMALAGADDTTLEAIRPFCMAAGRAFQITDDILGTFASEQEAGKSPMDDIREGKRTVLSVTALERASDADKNFLIQMLGNNTLTQAEFARCKEIFINTGALQYATERAASYISEAKASLCDPSLDFAEQSREFLCALVDSLQGRNK